MTHRLIRAFRGRASAREEGQIIVLFAVFMITLMVLAGSAFDYATIVVDDTRLQNAVDASVLAGSDALSQNAVKGYGTVTTMARATTTEYLRLNGVATSTPGTNITITFPTSTPVAGATPPATPFPENITVAVTRNHPTSFWPLIGISSVNMVDVGSARAARGMIDVMLSLDTTASMDQEFPALRAAVTAFVNSMNPSSTDPRSPRIGLARWQGETCNDESGHNPRVYNCHSDYRVLSPLTGDASSLLKLAANTPSSGACPNGIASLGSGAGYACPIGQHDPGSGTKLPNGIYAVTGAGTGSPATISPYAWTTANARNNNPIGSGWAKKILILMTDGENNDNYDDHRSSLNSNWDTAVVSAATALQSGPTSDPSDDVEIYVVNFQCDASTHYPGGCTSELADRAKGDHFCPGPLPAATYRSNTDNVLIDASSSKAGTCDHYFPLRKDENLPALFLQLSGAISRAALTE